MEKVKLDLLKDVLYLLTTVDRDLEPWIEDTVCDNFITTAELTGAIERFFIHSNQNERFKLKILAQVLSTDNATVFATKSPEGHPRYVQGRLSDIQNTLVTRLLDKLNEILENNPIEALQLFTSSKVFHPILRGPKSLWVSTDNTKHATLLHTKAIQHLFTSNLNVFKSAVSVLAEGCFRDVKYFELIPSQFKPNVLAALPDQTKATNLFRQEYNIEDIVETCKMFTDKQLKLIGPMIVNSLDFDELGQTHDKICSLELYKTHSVLVRTMLFCLGDKLGMDGWLKNLTFFSDEKSLKDGALADCIEALVKYKTVSEISENQMNEVKPQEEFCEDYTHWDSQGYDAPSFETEPGPLYSNLRFEDQPEAIKPTAFTSNIISALFKKQPSGGNNFIVESLINDCTLQKQMKNVIRLLKSLIGLKALKHLMKERPGECQHSALCVPKQKCLFLSMITFMTETNSQKYALTVEFFAWVCINSDLGKIEEEEDRITWDENIAGGGGDSDINETYALFSSLRTSKKRREGIVYDFKTLVEKKIHHRDFIESTLELCLGISRCRNSYYSHWSPKLSNSIKKIVALSVLETFCKDDCDMYTRVSILEFFQKSDLVPPLNYYEPIYLESFSVISKMLTVLQYDDSMVAIAFFKMIKSHTKFFEKLLFDIPLPATDAPAARTNMFGQDVGNNDNSTMETIENIALVPTPNLDIVIATLVDAKEAEDAAVIQARGTREGLTNRTNANNVMGDKKGVLTALLEFIVEDRCDVERLEVGGSLLLKMLSMRKWESKQYFDFLDRRKYFNLLTSEQSLILNDVKNGLRDAFYSVGNGNESFKMFVDSIRVPGARAKKVRAEEDLMTVIALLKADPDPDLVCDCY